jgi:hypothetical protein
VRLAAVLHMTPRIHVGFRLAHLGRGDRGLLRMPRRDPSGAVGGGTVCTRSPPPAAPDQSAPPRGQLRSPAMSPARRTASVRAGWPGRGSVGNCGPDRPRSYVLPPNAIRRRTHRWVRAAGGVVNAAPLRDRIVRRRPEQQRCRVTGPRGPTRLALADIGPPIGRFADRSRRTSPSRTTARHTSAQDLRLPRSCATTVAAAPCSGAAAAVPCSG